MVQEVRDGEGKGKRYASTEGVGNTVQVYDSLYPRSGDCYVTTSIIESHRFRIGHATSRRLWLMSVSSNSDRDDEQR
jgi:hypothetical protein